MGTPAQFVEQAMLSGFQQGQQEKQQKKDEEHALKINDLISQREGLASKFSTLQPGTPEYEETHKALQGVNLDLAEAYHPAKHPNAIKDLGHLLTDHVGLTSPEKRAAQQATQQQAKVTAAGQATDRQIAAAPPSAAQLDIQKIQAKLSEIDKSNISDEDKAEARRAVFGIKTKANYQQFKLPDGTIGYYDVTQPDSIPEGATAIPKGAVTTAKENIEEYNKAVAAGYKGSLTQWVAEQRRAGAPSTSALNEGREDYSKSHGFSSWNDIPDQYRDVAMNYMIRKQAMDKAYPTSTTTTSYQENYQHQMVPVVATNYKTPQGTETLKDPLWFLAAPAPKPGDRVTKGTEKTTSSATPPKSSASPKDLLAEASSKNPAGAKSKTLKTPPTTVEATWASQNPKPKSVGNVRVGNPLFAKKNKEYDDAQTAYDGALDRVDTMEKNLKSALNSNPPDQQAMLSLVANHIGMTLGAQKGARINQAVWNEAVASAPWLETEYAKAFHNDPQTGEMVFDGWKSGVTLTPGQMKSMVALAHEREDTLKTSLKRIEDRLNAGVANPSSSSSSGGKTAPDAAKAKGSVSITQAMTLPKYKGKTREQVSDAITKAGYLPIE